MAVQLFAPGSSPVGSSPSDFQVFLLGLGVFFLAIGNLFLLARGYDLRPGKGGQSGEWGRTTRDRFRAVRDLERKVRAWDETLVDLTCALGIVSLAMVVGMVVLGAALLSSIPETEFWAIPFAIDAGVLILPHWITGTRRGWRPIELKVQIDSLEMALAEIERYADPPCQIQPMLEMSGSGENQVPTAARVFIRFPDGPEDFLGLQLQVAVNNVQGTKYPYLYAVIIAKKSFGLLEKHKEQIRKSAHPLTVESTSEDDADVIIVRQATTKTSGYHTKRSVITDIASMCWRSVTKILAAGGK
jgi:hypothetical protein